jgi:hypothetical protein
MLEKPRGGTDSRQRELAATAGSGDRIDSHLSGSTKARRGPAAPLSRGMNIAAAICDQQQALRPGRAQGG